MVSCSKFKQTESNECEKLCNVIKEILGDEVQNVIKLFKILDNDLIKDYSELRQSVNINIFGARPSNTNIFGARPTIQSLIIQILKILDKKLIVLIFINYIKILNFNPGNNFKKLYMIEITKMNKLVIDKQKNDSNFALVTTTLTSLDPVNLNEKKDDREIEIKYTAPLRFSNNYFNYHIYRILTIQKAF